MMLAVLTATSPTVENSTSKGTLSASDATIQPSTIYRIITITLPRAPALPASNVTWFLAHTWESTLAAITPFGFLDLICRFASAPPMRVMTAIRIEKFSGLPRR